MADLSIQALRELQRSLNTAFDSYIDEVESNTAALPGLLVAGGQVSHAANQILDAFADPLREGLRIPFQPTQNLAMRISVDLDLFNLIKEKTSLAELANQTKADPHLLYRILRLLVATRIFQEPEAKVYSSTKISKVYQEPSVRDWVKTCYDTLQPIWLQTPKFLAENGFSDIKDLSKNPTLAMYGSNFWEQLAQDPKREADFASAMSLQDLAPKMAFPQFPYEEAYETFSADASTGGSNVFLVDVGGGRGQYLSRIIETHPELPGRKILQDLPSVITDVDTSTVSFEPMGHDFFTDQPIEGAKYYHLRGILHDWPDEACIEILSRLQAGFKPGFSQLLIHTSIFPDENWNEFIAMEDVNLWTCCGLERTEKEWHALLQKAGFGISRIVKAEIGPYAIIEADLSPRAAN